MSIKPEMTAEEAWAEYRKRGEAIEDFESFKQRWDAAKRHRNEVTSRN